MRFAIIRQVALKDYAVNSGILKRWTLKYLLRTEGMLQADNFLHTTHRTVSWFRKTFLNDELELSAPFQRNPVWTDIQKAYLIDTILNGLPIPELYMQDVGNEEGDERHIVVDGQQRVR